MQQNVANIHAGEQSYMVMPSDLFDNTSMRQYSVTFQGIQGNGKQFNTTELIEQRQKAIYNRLGAGALVSESDTDVTSEGRSFLSLTVDRDKDVLIEAINTQVIPQLLSLNGYSLSEGDTPKFTSLDITPPNVADNSSAIQRVVGVSAIPLTPEVINEFYRMLGIEYRIPDSIVSDPEAFQEFLSTYLPSKTSRSGDGIIAGQGNGTSTQPADVDTSVANKEN